MDLTLSPARPDLAEATALAARIEAEDGAPPLSDQVFAQLTESDGDTVTHVVAREGDRLVGYAQRSGEGLELAAEPEAVAPLLDEVAAPPLLVWSHGRRSRLVAEFEQRGWTRARELFQLRRPFDGAHPLPDPRALPDGITLRTFEPGRDDAPWLALNAAAFADHPEQGRWTQRDLAARLAEPWFDAAGFLLADRAGELVAFHWTKVHPDGAGEVYVLGVSPAAQGGGLGRTMLLHGLHHLAARGCPYALLYVDGDNAAARRLYERDGFATYDVDVQWRA